MSDPKQSEVDAAIAALDKSRGETVPVDKLLAKIDELWAGQISLRAHRLVSWIIATGGWRT